MSNNFYHLSGYRGRQEANIGKVIKSFIYRGCVIKILHYRGTRFKFEYVISIPNRYLRLTSVKGKLCRELLDRTTHTSMENVAYFGKVRINELLSPFWFKKN